MHGQGSLTTIIEVVARNGNRLPVAVRSSSVAGRQIEPCTQRPLDGK